MTQTFDDHLNEDEKRRADILRRSISSETALAEYEAGADRIKQKWNAWQDSLISYELL